MAKFRRSPADDVTINESPFCCPEFVARAS